MHTILVSQIFLLIIVHPKRCDFHSFNPNLERLGNFDLFHVANIFEVSVGGENS